MIKNDFVIIEANESDKRYVIRNNSKIEIGNIQIIEYSDANKNCTFRLYFYEKENKYLKEAIKVFIDMLFNNIDLFKINVLVRQDIELQAFFDFNFSVEGVIKNNIIKSDKFNNEILLGIDYDTYKSTKYGDLLRLNGNNIYLRILSAYDSDKLLNYYKRNKEYLRHFEELKNENFYTIEFQKNVIIQNYVQFLNKSQIFFGIFKDEAIIGIIQLYDISWGIFKSATIGYSIDEKEQQKGYAKEAVKLILEYAFNTLKLHRIQAATLIDNVKSKSVLKACGFKEIGISEKYLFINGNWEDHCIFYKLNF